MELHRQEFIDWLSEYEPAEKAGVCRMTYKCPIANFIKSREGGSYRIRVGLVSYSIKGYKYNTPGWVYEFILLVDSRKEDSITYQECLDILEESICVKTQDQ